MKWLVSLGFLASISSSCRLPGDDSDLLDRERQRLGYTNELQTLRELREQLVREEEVLEIYQSELDRIETFALELRGKIDRTRGQVAALDSTLRVELGKVSAIEKQTAELAKKKKELNGKLTALQDEIQKKEGEQGALQAKDAEIAKSIEELKRNVAVLEADEESLRNAAPVPPSAKGKPGDKKPIDTKPVDG